MSHVTFSVFLIFAILVSVQGVCDVNGVNYPTGAFRHPNDECKVCYCCPSGGYTCKIRECSEPECGVNKQEWSDDGCCKVCKPECNSTDCSLPDVPKARFAYTPDACCPTAGCNLHNTSFTIDVVPRGPFGSCGRCRCKASGLTTCSDITCPAERLKCVDARAEMVNGTCNFMCPNGVTCRRSGVLLKAGEFREIGFLLCTCLETPYYPRGFCLKPSEWNEKIVIAQTGMCAAPTPELPVALTSDQAQRLDLEKLILSWK